MNKTSLIALVVIVLVVLGGALVLYKKSKNAMQETSTPTTSQSTGSTGSNSTPTESALQGAAPDKATLDQDVNSLDQSMPSDSGVDDPSQITPQ